jgi:hypothetical protein
MKKVVLSVIFLFKLSDAMDAQVEKDPFETFKATCKSKKVNRPSEVCIDQIQTNPTELCAAIRHLSWLARELPPESYEQSLKQLLREQREKDWNQYQKVVSQLAHMALSRHRESCDYISPLIFKALRKQFYECQEQRGHLRDTLAKDVNQELLTEYDQLQVCFANSQRDLERITRKLNKTRQEADAALEIKNGRLRQLEQQADVLEREKGQLRQWSIGHQVYIKQLEEDIRNLNHHRQWADDLERQNGLLRQSEMDYQTRMRQLEADNALLRQSREERAVRKKNRGLCGLLRCCGKK